MIFIKNKYAIFYILLTNFEVSELIKVEHICKSVGKINTRIWNKHQQMETIMSSQHLIRYGCQNER